MTENRSTRERKTLRVKLADADGTYPATITTISKTGMSVKCAHVFPTFTVIDVLVKMGQEVAPIKGSIRWVHEAPPDAEDRSNEIGIALQNPPPEYVAHFD